MDAWMRWNGQGMTVLSNEINYVAVKKKVSKHTQTRRKYMYCEGLDNEVSIRDFRASDGSSTVCSLSELCKCLQNLKHFNNLASSKPIWWIYETSMCESYLKVKKKQKKNISLYLLCYNIHFLILNIYYI